jgi:hypothetical protein
MYYKVTDKNCEIYKNLFSLRKQEIKFDEQNLKEVQEKVKIDWIDFDGNVSQKSYTRVIEYYGFKFTYPNQVDLTIWKRNKEKNGFYYPNKRTKKGREMDYFLNNGLKKSDFRKILKILDIDFEYGVMPNYPYLELFGDTLLMYLGDATKVRHKDVIEITSEEYFVIKKIM